RMTQAALIATLSAPPSAVGAELMALPDSVQWLEVRADLAGEIDPDWLRDHFSGRLIYANRSHEPDRQQRLIAAARHYDRVEIESDRDCSDEVLTHISPEKRIVSWYGHVDNLSELREL